MPYRSPAHGVSPASFVSRLLAPLREAFSFFLLVLLLLFFHLPACAQTEVSNCDEASLNQAIADAALDNGVVVFTEDCSITLTAPIVIDPDALGWTNFVIDARGHTVSIEGDVDVRVFEILTNASVTLIGLTIANGQTNQGGGLFISEQASAVLTNCTFTGNSVTGTNGVDGAAGSNSNSDSGGNGHNGTAGEAVCGGAIFNAGDLVIWNSTFVSNSATGGKGGAGGQGGSGTGQLAHGGNGGAGGASGTAFGGAIYSSGTLSVSNCTFSGNTAIGADGGQGGAGGSAAFPGLAGSGTAGAQGSGAAIYSLSPVELGSSTFSDNSARGGNGQNGGSDSNGDGVSGRTGGASSGGGIYTSGGTLVNSTFYHNNVNGGAGGSGGPGVASLAHGGNGGNGGTATGGGLYSLADIQVVSCSFSNCNAQGGTNGLGGTGPFPGSNGSAGASRGGDIAHGSGTFTLQNTILATNSSGGANYGSIVDAGYNIGFGTTITFRSGSGSFKTNNVKLGPLADNGGPTKTMKPAADSPALDQIPPGAYFPPVDQRGIPRPINVNADIGAVEVEQDKGPPVITVQPTNAPASLGSNATFSVTAHGSPTLKYYWRFNGSFIPGATKSSFTVTNATPSNAGPYTVLVSNALGTALSSPVLVKFAPVITNQPVDQTINPGQSAFFSVGVLGDTNQLHFQWKFNGSDISNATNSSITINNAQTADSGNYTVAVTNAYGGTVSTPAALNLYPKITSQPTNQTVAAGSTVIFSVSAAGSLPLSYQWRFNGNNLVGNTGSSYAKANVQPSDSGNYDVVVTNRFGAVTSLVATLAVTSTSAPPVISQARVNSGNFSFSVNSQSGMTYIVDYRTNVLAGNWTPLFTNTATSNSFTFSTPATNSMRFFRVRTQ